MAEARRVPAIARCQGLMPDHEVDTLTGERAPWAATRRARATTHGPACSVELDFPAFPCRATTRATLGAPMTEAMCIPQGTRAARVASLTAKWAPRQRAPWATTCRTCW